MAGGSYHPKHYRAGPWDFPTPAVVSGCMLSLQNCGRPGVNGRGHPIPRVFCWENLKKTHLSTSKQKGASGSCNFIPPTKSGNLKKRTKILLWYKNKLCWQREGRDPVLTQGGWQGGCDEKLCAVVSNLAGKEKSALCLKFKDWFPNALPLKMGLSHSHVGFLQGIHYTVFFFFWVCTPF